MEYIILEQQQNTYPTTSNYKKTALDTITLEGNFDTNKLDFDIPTFDPLVIVPDTSFRFLISIEDTIYTSPSYYTELITSYNESNPYFIQSTFQSEFLVKYNLNDIASIIANLKVTENSKKINVTKNVFVLADGSYDYISLVKYIDWVVSPIGLDEIETNGVLSAKQLSQYTLPEIPKPQSLVTDVATVEIVEENIQAYQWEYRRVKNLKKEPYAVRETKNTTSRELYRINEGDNFIGNYIGNGLFEIFDDAKTARVGYIDVPKSQVPQSGQSKYATLFVRFKQVAGPFNIKILTIKQPSNSTSNTTTPSTPSTGGGSSGGGASVGGGGGSSYGGGYNNGRDNMGGGNNTRYNQR